MRRLGFLLFGVICGTAVAGVSAFIHADRFKIAGVTIPFGVFLAVSTIFALQLWLTRYFQSRSLSLGYAIGWVGMTIVLASWPTESDLVLPNEVRTWVYLALGGIAVAMGASLPVLSRPELATQRHPGVLS